MFASLPVVQDPWFYAIAVPAVLLTGLSKSGFASGFGSLATPMLALAVPVPQAAAIMLPVLLAQDAIGLQQLWRNRDRALLRELLGFGLLGLMLGWLLFGLLRPNLVAGVVGALTLGFLAQRLLFPPRPDGTAAPRWVGPFCGGASGFTSFVAHAGAPPFQAYVLPKRLPPLTYSATAATFFAVMNASKIVPYGLLGVLDVQNLLTSAMLLPLTPLGVWLGVWLTKRISRDGFYRIAYLGMALTGAKLLSDGFRG